MQQCGKCTPDANILFAFLYKAGETIHNRSSWLYKIEMSAEQKALVSSRVLRAMFPYLYCANVHILLGGKPHLTKMIIHLDDDFSHNLPTTVLLS